MSIWMKPDIPPYEVRWVSPWGWEVQHTENFTLGWYTDIASGAKLLAHEGIEIGYHAQVGPNAVILSLDTESGKRGKVVLKRYANVGANATVMPGITIGENATLGAGAVLTTNIPDNETWVGIPARKLSKSI